MAVSAQVTAALAARLNLFMPNADLTINDLTLALRELASAFNLKLFDHDMLVQIAADQRHLMDKLDRALQAHDTALSDHESRVRSLEGWHFKVIGAAAATSAIVTLLARLFLH